MNSDEKGLYTSNINELLASDQFTHSINEGTFACDELNNIVINKFPRCLVINLDKSFQPGSHWVGLYFESPDVVDFFDSYARRLSKYADIDQFVKSTIGWRNKAILQNHSVLQGENTNVCGHWVVLFLWYRSRGIQLSDFVCLFNDQKSGTYDNYIKDTVSFQYCLNSLCPKLPDIHQSVDQTCVCKLHVCCTDD